MAYNATITDAPSNASMTSATYDTSTQKFGTAALNGGYGSIAAGATKGGPTFTWECWVKRSTIPSGNVAVAIGGPGYIGINTSGKAVFNGATGNVTVTDPGASICDGNWHHLAMVGHTGGFRCYVDGTSVGTSATAQPYAAQIFYIGCLASGGSFPFFTTGTSGIDEVAFFNYEKYNANFTPPASPYVDADGALALYHLDSNGNDSSTAYDTLTPCFGTAALRRGRGDISAGAALAGPTFTWECRVKRSSVPGAIAVAVGAGDGGASSAGYIGINTSGKAVFNGATGNVTLTDPGASICDGNWHHLAMVGHTGGFRCYVDGVQVASSTTAQGYTGSAVFHIGALTSGSSSPFFATSGIQVIDEVAFFSFEKYTSNFTPAASAYTSADGTFTLYHLDSNGNDSGIGAVSPYSAAMVYSPYNWLVTNTSAKTINSGAYFRTCFSGSSCTLNFDVTNQLTPYSQIWYRIDGYGPWTSAEVASTIVCTMPADTVTYNYHYLEMVVKSTTETRNRWNAPQNTAVVFLGLTLASGGALQAPVERSLKVIVYGDSITEGVRTVNNTAVNDTDKNDGKQSWAYALGELLDAEVGVVGFGAQGLTKGGNGNVPALGTSYNLLWASQARDLATDPPDLAIVMQGANDGSTDSTALWTAFINLYLAATPPSSKMAILKPFFGSQGPFIQAAIPACASPTRVSYKDQTFWVSADSSDFLHPFGWANLAKIAPMVAEAVRGDINGTRTIRTTRPMPLALVSL